MNGVKISVTEAKQSKLFYVVANIIVINKDEKACLLLKRSENEKVLPGKWAFPGGKLEHKDVKGLLETSGNRAIEGIDNILGELAVRECREECGLDIDAKSAVIIKNKVFIRPDNVPVFMTTLAADYRGGSVRLEDNAFSDFAWVRESELAGYDVIEGIEAEAQQALQLLLRRE